MSHADVYQTVSPIVPVRHIEWPNDSAPALPWAVYDGEDVPISADDGQAAVRHRWTVELYEMARDPELEQALATALRERFGSIRRKEAWIADEGMLQVVYTFYQIEGDFDG